MTHDGRNVLNRVNVITTSLCAASLIAGSAVAGGRTVGVFINEPDAQPGYTLFTSMSYRTTYLIDNRGNYVNAWESQYRPGLSSYLLDSGHLLRGSNPGGNNVFSGGGAAGLVEEFDWHGKRLWSFLYSNNLHRAHHDIERLPNGNVLMIAWELRTRDEAIEAGRNPARLGSSLWPDHIVEVEPSGQDSGIIVWEWHAWDHLIQDFDPTKDNYGVVADHPELIDLNFAATGSGDWLHVNAVDYNAALDQIVVSSPYFDEIWIIDHSTTTEESAGHSGGNGGRGGDLLYRWGNPLAYRAGDASDQRLFGQHDVNWIADGLPGAGHLLVFNNGVGRPGGSHSSIDEFVTPVDEDGNYTYTEGEPYGPDAAIWSYEADPPGDFFASFISGTRRLPNGNTIVCDGPAGEFFEVTPEGETVWLYVNPVISSGPLTQGQHPANRNSTFRAERYPPDFPGFEGRDLTPGWPLEVYPCPPDFDLDDEVGFTDLLEVLTRWGDAGGREDLDANGAVDFGDLLIVLGAWGPCS